MAVSVNYNGNEITSFTNTTKTLQTAGTYLEDDITITESGLYIVETGTYTPTADAYNPTISFTNIHSEAPIYVAMTDTSDASGITSNSIVGWMAYDPYKLFGTGFPYSTSATRYMLVHWTYKSSSGMSASGLQVQYNSDNSGNSSTSYSRYWLTETGFKAYSNSSSRYWRANRNYKWLAIWKP